MKERKVNQKYWKKSRLWSRLRARRDNPETTKMYTEEEVQNLSRSQSNGSGIIRPDTGELHLPSGIEETTQKGGIDSASKVMLVIVTLTLIFICFIAYLVHEMPKKD